ncbi:MAG: methyltransferase domain-containing protein [Phycisphaerae bacterium]|nr:methyltransferase domain-containing protein [Phycisphaerae bacterium]MDD5381681.1 methyltransferase domain-containing protein [Phycisphaerae bacterium]
MDKHTTSQSQKWESKLGEEYTERNIFAPEQLDQLYVSNYGISRTALNEAFLGNFERSVKILEVGSNLGNQLLSLQRMGFENLYGIEVNSYAIEHAKNNTKNINIIRGNAFDIPFKDRYFDIVFTSGVLIHIAPQDIERALQEIHRCSREYIWGFEYYADSCTEVRYRGHTDLLWKTNFAGLYLNSFDDLELVKEKKLKYLGNENIDTMFLIKKRKS